MSEQIKIWLVGNTGLRNPNRIQEGFSVFASSAFVGHLHGRDNELGFMNLLDEKGIIQNEEGKDSSGSHARKWRLMFAKNGLIYPQVQKKDGRQEDLGPLDDITPFGRSFLKADTYPAVQECYLRAMSVEQFPMPDGVHYFSPLRWLLAIMLELEKRTGSSELSRIEFALWGHTTNPSYSLEEVVDNILDLRQRRAAAPAKRPFDKKEIAKRGENYDKKADNFLDYSDMNMRYLRISGVLQRKGSNVLLNSECARIKKYLDANYAENITLDTLAALSHMNKYYMAHAFAKYMGVSPITYLLQKRIEEGKSLLSSTSHSISQIATSLGFSSQSYFSQAFKKATGRTPVQYRAECKRGRQGTV